MTFAQPAVLSDVSKIEFVEIFTRSTPPCSYCDNAKKLLRNKLPNIRVIEYDFIHNSQKFTELKSKYPTVKNVPQILVTMKNGSRWHIGGYNELLQGFLVTA